MSRGIQCPLETGKFKETVCPPEPLKGSVVPAVTWILAQ